MGFSGGRLIFIADTLLITIVETALTSHRRHVKTLLHLDNASLGRMAIIDVIFAEINAS